MTPNDEPGRVLSIQSHVSYGYVGGKAAVFPLQCLGYDVDVVNTVNFSNHVGYGRFGGTRATAEDLGGIFRSLEESNLLTCQRVVTGYIPGAEALSTVSDFIARLRRANPDLIYLLDPVMGDSGRLYVAETVVPVYKSLLPLATVITPNWFEVEVLTDTPLTSISALRKALRTLHDEYKVPHVVISSLPLAPWLRDALPANIAPPADGDFLCCVSSSAASSVHARCVSALSGYFSGVGDLFSALLLAHFAPASTTPLASATAQALAKTHAILRLTHAHAQAQGEAEEGPSDVERDAADPLRKVRRMARRELRLVQGQHFIRGEGLGEVPPMEEWSEFWDT